MTYRIEISCDLGRSTQCATWQYDNPRARGRNVVIAEVMARANAELKGWVRKTFKNQNGTTYLGWVCPSCQQEVKPQCKMITYHI